MSRRSPVPVSITDPEHQAFLDDLWKRKVGAVAQVSATPTTTELATALNALITAMQASKAMDSD